MMFRIKYNLVVSIVVFKALHLCPTIVYAQNDDLEQKVVELQSLKINQQIDLNKIFSSDQELLTEKLETNSPKESQKPYSLELVGTLILGEKKFAWLKVDGQVYQLKSGQKIPGMQTQIAKINPEFVVLDNYKSCEIRDSCHSSLTLTIRDALF